MNEVANYSSVHVSIEHMVWIVGHHRVPNTKITVYIHMSVCIIYYHNTIPLGKAISLLLRGVKII